ncbi:hypothetical protein MHYP_G00289430 [Metynnis hypsauchen]
MEGDVYVTSWADVHPGLRCLTTRSVLGEVCNHWSHEFGQMVNHSGVYPNKDTLNKAQTRSGPPQDHHKAGFNMMSAHPLQL